MNGNFREQIPGLDEMYIRLYESPRSAGGTGRRKIAGRN